MNLLLTGASGGIGQAIIELFKAQNHNIYTINSRLEDTKSLEKEAKEIFENKDIDILINCAGYGIFKPHDQLKAKEIENLIAVNLTAPILLSKLSIQNLKKTKGHIINISSIEATKNSKNSALYTASKSGLREFSLCLFEDLRKYEIKVTSINPDITKTSFFDDLTFEPTNDELTFITAKTIAKTILDIVQSDAVITDLTIRPQKFQIKKK